jgi:uncharacterized protein (TIGR02145 family)
MEFRTDFFRWVLIILTGIGLFFVLVSSCKKDDKPQIIAAADSFTDHRDGSVYKTVNIGEQIWMAENLKFLPTIVGPATASQTLPYCYVYGYDGTIAANAKESVNYLTYGVLYNWPAAMNIDTTGTIKQGRIQGNCPPGWHIPDDAEWSALIEYLGGLYVSGGKLKESDTLHWESPNSGASNESGFTALPGGLRRYDSEFYGLGNTGFWWSATESSAAGGICYILKHSDSGVVRTSYNKSQGLNVRCVKD